MEEGLKGVLITLTLASLFVMSILSFITLFPLEQGIVFTNNADNDVYLIMENTSNTEVINSLTTIQNSTEIGFNQWDVTQGFMGSNTIKQTSGTGITSYAKNLFSTLTIIATQLFGANSPVVYAIGVFSVLAGAYIIYLIITFIRTGR
jgi:hypothetical protein